MKSERRPKGILTTLVVLSLIIGLVGGYLLAHRNMPEMTPGRQAAQPVRKYRLPEPRE